MQVKSLYEYLSANRYPGRGIVIGKTKDEKEMAIGYFIMGRSENSRNRVFVPDGDGLRTEAFDPAKLSDPSLVIYAPVRVSGETTIVTNGDQTDTIYDYLQTGKTFQDALRTRTFEPDGPIFTPRISGTVTGDFYELSILKSTGAPEESTGRFFYEYTATPGGFGHIIHTYMGDGDPVPSYEGEPTPVTIEDDFGAFGQKLWNALDEQNKVSLFVRFIDITTGKTRDEIFNKNK